MRFHLDEHIAHAIASGLRRRATHTLGQIIEHLVLIDACLTEEEMANHVEHF